MDTKCLKCESVCVCVCMLKCHPGVTVWSSFEYYGRCSYVSAMASQPYNMQSQNFTGVQLRSQWRAQTQDVVFLCYTAHVGHGVLFSPSNGVLGADPASLHIQRQGHYTLETSPWVGFSDTQLIKIHFWGCISHAHLFMGGSQMQPLQNSAL